VTAVIATEGFARRQARRLSLPRPGDGPVPFYVSVTAGDALVPVAVFRAGIELAGEVTCLACGERVRLLGGEWTTADGTTDCYGALSPGYAPHDPVRAPASIRTAGR
jgi:hypothetical protein